ncbi:MULTISPECIES: AbrB/MazE/SpoVT family DNA-binding domain-containing protein [Rickettsia]|uniref:AbrB/MazE/SpoVT family DNA-binding domain-containing protein n=1 Tax=Rickettsia TaxID=780 RepID=UPI00050A2E71|nr:MULTISPECIES: AbrB/MazE/SpoVT family DNA-binding domain-containing protein [Rickettsia]
MQTMRTKLGEGGRIVIPASFRQNLHLLPGDDIVLHMKENIIYITTPNQALAELQAMVKNYTDSTGERISLVDELIKSRRLEASHE